jgi:hypothetical protein
MVGSSKKGTTKRPKRRKGKAPASETGSTDFNKEDYNIRSLEHAKLLIHFKEVIGNVPVSPAF